MSEGKRTVLIVDDNDMMRKLLAAELGRDARLAVELAATGSEGLAKAVSANPSVIVLDMILPDISGVEFLEQLKIRRPDCPSVIAITGATEAAVPDSVIEAPYRGLVSAVFRKPFDHAKLRETVAFCAGC